MKTITKVYATRDVPSVLTGGEVVAKGDAFDLLRDYWRNGEGWHRLRRGATTFDAPSVFFDNSKAEGKQ